MKSIIIAFVLAFSLSLLASDFEETRKFTLDTDGISRLFIDCGAGFLKVTGKENSERIFVRAHIQMENVDSEEAEKILDRYLELKLEKRGRNAELISNFESTQSIIKSIFTGFGNVRVDLTVEVPTEIDVDVDDGSGFIEIKNIKGDLFIDDGSDYIEISDVIGKIEIDDGSGDIDIEDVEGRVEIDDGSGEIDIHMVKGDVFLDDGSGRITVSDVDGNVRVDDGSGSINIKRVEEDVIIEDDGSGSVNIYDIAGNVYRYDE